MMNTPIQRRATTEEWNALLSRLRSSNPRIAKSLKAGSTFTDKGVKLLPPLGFVCVPTTVHGPTIERAMGEDGRALEPRFAETEAERIDRERIEREHEQRERAIVQRERSLGMVVLRAVERGDALPEPRVGSGHITKHGTSIQAADDDLAALTLSGLAAESE